MTCSSDDGSKDRRKKKHRFWWWNERGTQCRAVHCEGMHDQKVYTYLSNAEDGKLQCNNINYQAKFLIRMCATGNRLSAFDSSKDPEKLDAEKWNAMLEKKKIHIIFYSFFDFLFVISASLCAWVFFKCWPHHSHYSNSYLVRSFHRATRSILCSGQQLL